MSGNRPAAASIRWSAVFSPRHVLRPGCRAAAFGFRVSSRSGALPTGTPVDMEVVVRDEVGDSLEFVEFYDRYVGNFSDDAPIPDAEGLYTLEFRS